MHVVILHMVENWKQSCDYNKNYVQIKFFYFILFYLIFFLPQ